MDRYRPVIGTLLPPISPGCAELLEAGHQQPLKPVRTSAAFQAQLLVPAAMARRSADPQGPVWWPDPCRDVRSGQPSGTLSGKIAGVHSAPAAACERVCLRARPSGVSSSCGWPVVSPTS